MSHINQLFNRRTFIKTTSTAVFGTTGMLAFPLKTELPLPVINQENINIVGPKKGFSPQIGTLVSMMNWMRSVVLGSVRRMNIKELDYIHDKDANSIGAMLLHLGATERFYQINTFEGKRWGDWSSEDRKNWSIPSGLGERARQTIKGHPLDYYLDKLKEVREYTLREFAKRDDDWLMAVDENWGWGPTNNYCKWFHVCEHESNHNGQIKWIRNRLPV
ncbi:DinB family protein [Aquimarina gracilis]|uniref:DinB family protein n=1 Tax=Aquimarina gracilis TaxID=874422 RepID=A0ABU5ZWR4_9FLAO|nr:DinB family protein [Aquimarina gracilis]MEB3346282.1 DinB family protein [Aquimarina gracilis]